VRLALLNRLLDTADGESEQNGKTQGKTHKKPTCQETIQTINGIDSPPKPQAVATVISVQTNDFRL
jgi:hypothetical protein